MNRFIEIIKTAKDTLINEWTLLNQSLEVLPEVRRYTEEDIENE